VADVKHFGAVIFLPAERTGDVLLELRRELLRRFFRHSHGNRARVVVLLQLDDIVAAEVTLLTGRGLCGTN